MNSAPADAPPPPSALPKDSGWYQEVQEHYANAKTAIRDGKREEAHHLLDTVIDLLPGYMPAVVDKLRLLREDGRYQEAAALADVTLQHKGDNPTLLQERALAQIGLGDSAGALATLAPILSTQDSLPFARYIKSVAQAKLGDREAALTSLEEAVAKGYVDLGVIEKEQAFQPLRGEERFQGVIERLHKFHDYIRRTKMLPAGTTTPRESPEGEGAPPEAPPSLAPPERAEKAKS